MDDHIDIDLFIDEIQKRPVIWNMESGDYRNRDLRKNSWEEMADIFCDRDDANEKKVLGSLLQKKWKNMRDSFSRELRRQKYTASGSCAKNNPSYIYFRRLSFLEKSVSNKDTTSNFDEDNTKETEEPDLDLQRNSLSESSIKRIKFNPIDKHYSEILTKSIQLREKRESEVNFQDEDKLFCLSLYKELRKVPEDSRMKTKFELLQVIQRAQDIYTPIRRQNLLPPYTHQSYQHHFVPNPSHGLSPVPFSYYPNSSSQQYYSFQPEKVHNNATNQHNESHGLELKSPPAALSPSPNSSCIQEESLNRF